MSYIKPVVGGWISDDFSEHVARKSVNPGVDLAVAVGTNVLAPGAGVIKVADVDPGGAAGRYIVIFHDNGDSSDLLHLSSLLVKVGQRVTQGQHIAESGGSANGSNSGVGAHLHWTLRVGRQVATLSNAGNVDPMKHVGSGNLWDDTKSVQTRLNVWLAFWKLPLLVVDGVYGAKSRAAIVEAQKRLGLVADGKVGPATWAAISKNPAPVVAPPVVAPPVVTPPVVTPPVVAPPVVTPPVEDVAPGWFMAFLRVIVEAITKFLTTRPKE